MHQHKEVDGIERKVNKDFESICDWFVDNKLNTHFGEDKTKTILFTSKRRAKNVRKLNIKYSYINMKR